VKNDKSPVVPALLKEPSVTQFLRDTNVTVANTRSGNYPEKKTAGLLIRGCGAATKGKMARGPMG
jgi:hypothetical protein